MAETNPQPLPSPPMTVINYEDDEDDEVFPPRPMPLVPPLGFGMVDKGIYRSGHPLEINFLMLERLGLRTIVYLADQPYAPENISWCQQHNITIHHFPAKHVREPHVLNDPHIFRSCVKLMADTSTHPILLHSNKGKHRVGVAVGCYRKEICNWTLESCFAEYGLFSGVEGGGFRVRKGEKIGNGPGREGERARGEKEREKGGPDLEFIEGFAMEERDGVGGGERDLL